VACSWKKKCGTYLEHLTDCWSHKWKYSFTSLEISTINGYLEIPTTNVCAFFGYVLKLCVRTEEIYLVIRKRKRRIAFRLCAVLLLPFSLCNKCSWHVIDKLYSASLNSTLYKCLTYVLAQNQDLLVNFLRRDSEIFTDCENVSSFKGLLFTCACWLTFCETVTYKAQWLLHIQRDPKKIGSISYVYISWTIHDMWMIYMTFERGGPTFSNTTARALA
jgi:hypothetical protein